MKLLYAIRKKGIGNKILSLFSLIYSIIFSILFNLFISNIKDIEEIYNEDVRTPENELENAH